MRNAFLDTSTLVKIYYKEEDNGEVIDKMNRAGIERICLCEISKVEFTSAILKKARQGKITKEKAESLIEEFQNNEEDYIWQEINTEILQRAEELIREYSSLKLKTLDALQLASALELRDNEESDFFLTHDSILCNAFGRENLLPL